MTLYHLGMPEDIYFLILPPPLAYPNRSFHEMYLLKLPWGIIQKEQEHVLVGSTPKFNIFIIL